MVLLDVSFMPGWEQFLVSYIGFHKKTLTISQLTTGTVSICSMLIIGFDRYNVIVKGFNGTKITSGKAFGMIGVSWCYAVAVCTPPFLGWGKYALGKTTTIL